MRNAIRCLLLFATVAGAQAQDLTPSAVKFSPPPAGAAIGAGNLPADFYPKSPCPKPDAAGIADKPRDARDGKAVDAYNHRVQAYNKVAQAFNGCVVDYAARAQNDIARIQAAIRDANAH